MDPDSAMSPEPVLKRKALGDRSPNTARSPIPRSDMARNILATLSLTSVSVHRNPALHPVSLFEVPSESEIQLPRDKSDGYWLNHYYEFFQIDLNLDVLFDKFGGIGEKNYPKNYEFEGSENWDRYEMYGVTREEMLQVYEAPVRGEKEDFFLFLRAEGQLVRLMMAASDHPGRVLLLNAWIVLWTAYCGSKGIDALVQNLDRLEQMTSQWMACRRPGTTSALQSFRKLCAHQVKLNGHWIVVFDNLEKLRLDRLELLCHENCMCALHGWDCITYMQDAQLDWDDPPSDTEVEESELVDGDEDYGR